MSDEEEGHVPSWPAFVEKNWPERTLAYFDPAYMLIIDEYGSQYQLDGTLANLIGTLADNNLLLFVDQLVLFPFLADLLAEGHRVMCTRQGHPTGCRIKLKRGSRWIVQADSWQYRAGPVMLKTLREIFSLCEVGTQLTPSGLGQALMRRTYKEMYGAEWWKHTYKRPGMAVCHDILDNMTGGRVDTPGLGQHFEILTELDEKNAYAYHYRVAPCGRAIHINSACRADYATWFANCEIEIVEPLLLGPFPVRTEHKGRVSVDYPKTPGIYNCWVWKEQALDAELLGCKVKIVRGWAWNQFTEVNASWVALVEKIREEAPPIFKQAIVAAIGRHGSREYSFELVDGEHANPHDVRVADNDMDVCSMGVIYDWFVHMSLDENYNSQPHWYAWTIKECSRELFWRAYEWSRQELLAYTNYDAIGIIGDIDAGVPLKGSDEAKGLPSGSWRKEVLRDVYIPRARHVVSDIKVRRPGVKRSKQRT